MPERMPYETWLHAVDEIIVSRIGLTSGDLPDWLSRDCWEDGHSPTKGADYCMYSAGFLDDDGELVDLENMFLDRVDDEHLIDEA